MHGFASGLMEALLRDSAYILPQLFLAVLGTLMLWPGDLLFHKGEKHKWAPVTMAILAVVLFLVQKAPEGTGFSGMYKVDGLTKGFQYLSVLGALGAVALSQKVLNGLKEQTVEYYALILFSLSGMLFLCGATDFISFYFSLELMAICIYILVAYLRKQERGVEAGLKYFLLGAFSSGIMLYGISLLFAATGGRTTNFEAMAQLLPVVDKNNTLLVGAGTLMVLVGLGFKVAAVPFHMWSPDAYEGAPTPITAFMATAPKAASLAAFIRIFQTALPGLADQWMLPLAYVAAASMILGNVAAIKQQSMKRLLAYSSIAHVGYMLLGVMCGPEGAQATWLYMATYVVMNFGAFAIVIHLQGTGEGERIEDFRGLKDRHPFLAFAMMVFLLSLAGIPPLVGFFGKFYLFQLAVTQGHIVLVTIAFLASVVSAFYYLGVINQMYFKDAPALPEGTEPETPGVATALIVSVACALVLVGTAFARPMLDWAGGIGTQAKPAQVAQN
jgi:NADH-quinone oxidoreductase subunit N